MRCINRISESGGTWLLLCGHYCAGAIAALVFTFSVCTAREAPAATNDLTTALQRGLFEEEANHNYQEAIAAYESVVSRFDDNRKLAATAIFRLGEIYRKQGKTNEATAQFQRLIRDFSDQAALVATSKQVLATLGASSTDAADSQVTVSDISKTDSEEFARIQNLIKNSPDLINAPGAKGETLLQGAAAQGKLAIATMLIENGAAIEGVKSGGLTPLHFAAGNGHKAMVDLLLSKGAKPGAQASQGLTPLHLAVLKGYETVAKALIEAGAPVNGKLSGESQGSTADLNWFIHGAHAPLHVAVEAGYPALVSLLISKGAEINGESGGRTPLSYAVELHLQPIVEVLLKARADPNAGSQDLPLHFAAYYGENHMVESLLASGADPNRKSVLHFGMVMSGPRTVDGRSSPISPLSLAVMKKQVAAIKLLLEAKADPNEMSYISAWKRPIIYDALSDPAILELFLKAGANPNVKYDEDQYQNPPLQAVVSQNQQSQAELLLAHGADVNAANKNGWTALHQAAAGGSKPIAELLIKAGARVNQRDFSGNTPLLLAVSSKHPEVAQLLLESKADPNIRDKNGQTPLDIAKTIGMQPQALRLPGTTRFPRGASAAQPPNSEAIVFTELLHKYGAIDDLPRFDRIEVRRPSANQSEVVFSKGANDWDQFNLVELIGRSYHLLNDNIAGDWQQTSGPPSSLFDRTYAFPDFEHLIIHRPAPDGKSWTAINVGLQQLLDAGDCSRNQPLHWGDIVEIPEADHPIADQWEGLPEKAAGNLVKCLSRNITVIIKGAKTEIKVAPVYEVLRFNGVVMNQPPHYRIARASFMLRSVLDQFKLIRFSSDLTHVKVTRHDPTTDKDLESTLDCSDPNRAPALWLRDGDTIEIPDRT
jgi:cytohesin